MRRILEVTTRPDDAWARLLIQEEMKIPGLQVEWIDLSAPGQDYEELLRKIFQAEWVHVW